MYSLITIRFRDESSVSSGRCLKSACSLSTECVVQEERGCLCWAGQNSQLSFVLLTDKIINRPVESLVF